MTYTAEILYGLPKLPSDEALEFWAGILISDYEG